MTQQTASRSLIIQNDFALGIGLVATTRGTLTTQEQQIELIFIFRTLDEIRYLDVTRYTRVALHSLGPLVEYYFDTTSAVADDGDEILAPIPALTFGRWIKVQPPVISYDTTSLADITHYINVTAAKQAGYMVWNNTLNRPVWAVAAGDSAIWVDADGTTVHTPS